VRLVSTTMGKVPPTRGGTLVKIENGTRREDEAPLVLGPLRLRQIRSNIPPPATTESAALAGSGTTAGNIHPAVSCDLIQDKVGNVKLLLERRCSMRKCGGHTEQRQCGKLYHSVFTHEMLAQNPGIATMTILGQIVGARGSEATLPCILLIRWRSRAIELQSRIPTNC
jgi:hypothetical protein